MIADIFHRTTEVFQPFLADEATTEVVVNRPNEIGVENAGHWSWHDVDLPFEKLEAIAVLAAFHVGKDISRDEPICLANMPNGERLHIVVPPVTDDGSISLTARRPPSFQPTIEQLRERGMFESYEPEPLLLDDNIAKPEMPIELWLKLSEGVVQRKNIVISGATGSGKSTLARALIANIPLYERIITVEYAREWRDVPHRNWVPLKYNKTGRGVRAKNLVEAGLAMRPDRVLIGELTDEAAFHWIRNAIAGHPGGITTLHASTAEGAFDALQLMCRESEAGRMDYDDIDKMLRANIDIVVHCKHDPQARRYWIDDVYEKGTVKTRE